MSTGEIIDLAFPSKTVTPQQRQWRIQLMSKKTLINEFNHFEGDLSIFQPAIDISDTVLNREIRAIEKTLSDIEKHA